MTAKYVYTGYGGIERERKGEQRKKNQPLQTQDKPI